MVGVGFLNKVRLKLDDKYSISYSDDNVSTLESPMARDRMTITDYLAETEEPVDELWLAQTLSEAQAVRDEPADQEGWDGSAG